MRRVLLAVLALLIPAGIATGLWWSGAWVEPGLVDTVSQADLDAALAPRPDLPLSAAETDVVLIAVCTLRMDRLEPYGHDQPSSPFLRQLADSGVRFAHNFAQAPWTRPSMAALMTGVWPRAMRIDNLNSGEKFRRKIGDEHTLLSEHLAAAGYTGVGLVSNPNLKSMFGFAQGFSTYHEPDKRYGEGTRSWGAWGAVRTVLEAARAVPADERLYLQLNVIDTHAERHPPQRYLSVMGDIHPFLAEHDAAVRYVDAELARLLVALREERENILFVLAADHGEGLRMPKHHGPEHGNHVYRTTVETPLIMHHPALPQPGRQIDGLSMNIDVVPTVLDLLGLPVPDTIDGVSQAAAVLGETNAASHTRVFSETFFRKVNRSTVFDGRHQLIRSHHPGEDPPMTEALYAARDWRAQHDLAARKPRIHATLSAALTAWEAEMAARETAAKQTGAVPLDDETTEHLRQLGYIE